MGKKTNLTMLKCSNCGSSVFEQIDDDTYKCGYCGSISKDDDAEKQSFIKFLSSKSVNEGKIRVVKSMMSEKDFFKGAIEHIALEKNSPIDILKAKFSDVELRYSYYLIVKAEYKLATLSNEYFENVSFEQKSNKMLSINSQKSIEEDVTHEYIAVCSPLQDNAFEGQSEKVYNDIYQEMPFVKTTLVNAETLKEKNIKLPAKAKISAAIDRIVSETKAELLSNATTKNARVMHKIEDIELCIVPEYVLKFEYNGNKYEVSSFAYDLHIVGNIPNDSENLYKQVMQKTAKFPIVSIVVSALAAIFAFITGRFFKFYDFFAINLIIVPVVLLVFGSTFFIDKILTRNLLTKRYAIKREELKEFYKNNGIDPSGVSEFTDSFEGGE